MKNAKHIADRIRLLITTKQFQVGEILPSTRELGKQLNTSFHTVRKAYGMLAAEGLLRSEPGRGFVVHRQNTLLDKSARLEMGAEKMRVLLEELVGYGLDEAEVETLFEEQLMFIEWPERLDSGATVGATKEHGTMLARAIRAQVGVKSRVIMVSDTEKAVNFDALFVPVQFVRHFKQETESVLVLPVVYTIDAEILVQIVDRSAVQTIGILVRDAATIPILTNELKNSLQFEGSILAGVTDGRFLPPIVKDVDLILYTPDCATIAERSLPERNRIQLGYQISDHTSAIIRAELWDS